MQSRQAALVGMMVSLCAALALVPAVGAVAAVATPTDGSVAQADAANESASMGTQLSSFMQANSADANGTVDSGMWRASFNRSADKNRSVAARVSALEQRLTRLESRLAETEREASPETDDLVRASRLSAEIAALERAIGETESAAAAAGVNATRLDRLRSAARNASSHETVRSARNLTVVDPRSRRGPPAETGPPADAGSSADTGSPVDTGSDDRSLTVPVEANVTGWSNGEGNGNHDPGAGTVPSQDGRGLGDTGSGGGPADTPNEGTSDGNDIPEDTSTGENRNDLPEDTGEDGEPAVRFGRP